MGSLLNCLCFISLSILLFVCVHGVNERKRGRSAMSDEQYDIIVALAKGSYHVPVKDRSKEQRTAITRYYRNKKSFQLSEDKKVLFFDGKAVLKASELQNIVHRGVTETKGSGARKLNVLMRNTHSGLSERHIQNVLSRDSQNQLLNARFRNKGVLRPIWSKSVQFRHQIDLMEMVRSNVEYQGRNYRYILTVVDVFSRYLWMRPLERKTSKIVSQELQEIYQAHGSPRELQHDRGTEFCGAVERLCKNLAIKVIRSRPYHPQSQGKVERMHRELRKKITFDLVTMSRTGVNWVKQLPQYNKILNDAPKAELGWKSPFQIYYGRLRNREYGKQSTDACSPVNCRLVNPPRPKDFSDFEKRRRAMRKQAATATKHHHERQIRRNILQNPTSVYAINEDIIVKYAGHPKKNRIPHRRYILEGKVTKRNLKLNRYKVQFTLPGTGKSTEKWFSVSDLTSLTFRREKNRLRIKDIKKTACREIRKRQVNKYLIPFTKQDRLNYFQNEGYYIRFNPQPDGSCQFAALAHELAAFGVFRSESTLRSEIVEYLCSHPFNHDGDHLRNFVEGNEWEDYTREMLLSETFGDHLTLQTASDLFNLQIVVMSSLGQHATTFILPQGHQEFDEELHTIVLGHFAEEHGEQYVCLGGANHQLVELWKFQEEERNEGRFIGSRSQQDSLNDEVGDNRVNQNSSSSYLGEDNNNQRNEVTFEHSAFSKTEMRTGKCSIKESHSNRTPYTSKPKRIRKAPCRYSPSSYATTRQTKRVPASELLPVELWRNILSLVISTAPNYSAAYVGILQQVCGLFKLIVTRIVEYQPTLLPRFHIAQEMLRCMNLLNSLASLTPTLQRAGAYRWQLQELKASAGEFSGVWVRITELFGNWPNFEQGYITVTELEGLLAGWLAIVNYFKYTP